MMSPRSSDVDWRSTLRINSIVRPSKRPFQRALLSSAVLLFSLAGVARGQDQGPSRARAAEGRSGYSGQGPGRPAQSASSADLRSERNYGGHRSIPTANLALT